MGTRLRLYRAPDAVRAVRELNDWDRLWAIDQEGWLVRKRELRVSSDTGMPAGVGEETWASRGHDFSTASELQVWSNCLAAVGKPSLAALFGFSADEPEEAYLVPDWERSAGEMVSAARALSSATCHDDHERAVGQLLFFQELCESVGARVDREQYFVCWSG